MADVLSNIPIRAPLPPPEEILKSDLQKQENKCVKDIVRFPSYSDVRTRRETFNGTWPRGMRQTADACAEAGLFFINSGDKVVCFHCGMGIKDWLDTDIPWEEHAIWSPKCGFLLQKKGIDFILNVQECKNTCQKDGPIPILTCKHAPFINRQEPKEKLTILNADTIQDPSSARTAPTVCKTCEMRKSDVAFLPCGHVNTCQVCSPLVQKCPTCHKTHNGVMRIYYS